MGTPRKAGESYIEMYLKDKRLTDGLTKASAKMRRTGRQMQAAGRQMMTFAAGMAVPVIASVKAFADFENQMAQVQTMLGGATEHMAAFNKQIRQMSKDFGESTETLAKGLYDILSASIPAEKAMGVLEVSAKAAKAGITDTGTAADAITTILNSYGLEAEKAGDVSDWLFTIVKRGKTTFGELAPSIGKVASIAAAGGISMDEMGAALATMTRSGVQTEGAVTALGAVVQSFIKPTSEATAYAKTLGFELSSTTLKTEGLRGVFERIGKLPPDAIAKLFPNIRALRGVLPAMKNMTGFAEDLAGMSGRVGATNEAFEIMAKTFAFQFAQMKQQIIDLGVEIGSNLMPLMKEWSTRIGDAVKKFAEWIKEHPVLIEYVVKLGAAIGVAGVATYALGTAFSVVAIAMNPWVLALAGAAVAIYGLSRAVDVLNGKIYETNFGMSKLPKEGVANLKELNREIARTDALMQEMTDPLEYSLFGIKIYTGDVRTLNDEEEKRLKKLKEQRRELVGQAEALRVIKREAAKEKELDTSAFDKELADIRRARKEAVAGGEQELGVSEASKRDFAKLQEKARTEYAERKTADRAHEQSLVKTLAMRKMEAEAGEKGIKGMLEGALEFLEKSPVGSLVKGAENLIGGAAEQFKANLSGLMDEKEAVRRESFAAMGAFSANVLQSLQIGGASPAEQAAKTTQKDTAEIKKNTKTIADAVEDGGVVFSN